MTVTVYSKPNCGPCRATKHALQSKGIAFTEVDVSKDADGHAFVTNLGYRGVPVVHVSDANHWQGFDPDRIRAI